MQRIYLIQQDNEYFDTDIYIDFDDLTTQGITILGGSCNFMSKEFERIDENIDFICDEVERIEEKSPYREFDNHSKLFNYLLPKQNGKNYTTKEIHQLKEIFKKNVYDIDNMDLLYIMTGKKHYRTAIRGCCQGDYAEIIYPEDSNIDIKFVEACYFGTGTEYAVYEHDTDEILKPDELQEYPADEWHYTAKWSVDELKQEIATEFATTPDNVVVYNIDKVYTKRIYTYKEA